MSSDWIITKRLLGIVILAAGVLGFVGLLVIDSVRGGGGDFGPTQKLGLVACVGLAILGLTLIPLGDRPA